ncbi:Myb_DNA-binding domain-containing protein/SWIRM domain-containing protein [Cephalotus follicularis]|uniref:Myb_DNA-binding domain-containing protein/SWIRM domain-containing protein n=1 Tax=Cephalotus follicularis TaxID=3775 RepID=A0A1Q3BD48_CEPFO|nr:Myb_DNA-binding domain-containing protein/SWIRM domain-containing protein [Cephalotus follicularis]
MSATKTPVKGPTPDADVIHVPSYSRWFSWNNVHECEVRFLPEFFDSRSPSKTPRVYHYYRNFIIKLFRSNPSRKITFTDVRRTLVGDVGSIRRVFDFLDVWGLINYSPSALNKPLKWEDGKDSTSGGAAASKSSASAPDSNDSLTPNKEALKRLCTACKSLCTIACFFSDKYDLTLCARCYVRGNHPVGVSNSDFRRVELSEMTKTEWTEKETMQLLEAVMHYSDDWKKVAQHVSGRSEKDCIAQFIKLPFGEEFLNFSDSGEFNDKYNNQMKGPSDVDNGLETIPKSSPSKRMRLTPLADSSNPIMAQASFLSALAGVEIAEAAAKAAVTALYDVGNRAHKGSPLFLTKNTIQEAGVTSNGDTTLNEFERACVEANSLIEKDELDVERGIEGITEMQMKEIQDKIARFEELDLQMEKERQQYEQIKNQLFFDQLTVLFRKSSAPKTVERSEESVRIDVS